MTRDELDSLVQSGTAVIRAGFSKSQLTVLRIVLLMRIIGLTGAELPQLIERARLNGHVKGKQIKQALRVTLLNRILKSRTGFKNDS